MTHSTEAPITLLIVDDDPEVGLSLKRGLERTGRYRVLTAEGGEEGLALAQAHRPHVILLDMLMPRMTGADLAAALRGSPATAGVPVVYLTGILGKEDEAALGGCIDGQRFLAKPASVEEIDAALREALGR